MSRNLKEVSAKSYIATEAYNGNFFTYSVTTGPSPQFKKTGALTAVSGATSLNCPAGHILRENGKKLFPGAYDGVETYMVGVFDILNNLSGFINPNDPVFAPFNGDRPNYLKDSVNSQAKNLGSSVLTQGSVMCSGDVVSSGQIRCQDLTILQTVNGTPNTSTLNVSLGQVFVLSTTKDVTIVPTNMSTGAHVYIVVMGGGAHTVTFGTGMQGMGTLALTATGKVRTIHFICTTDSAMFELGRTAEFTDTT
uniref:Uncharacterized protein n=1 Tax=viral metagenome TaxID=1070528 RepID=A0A6C0DIX9_9ZZZZ